MQTLTELTASMAREGIRRLLVITGTPAWCEAQARALREALSGDWLWVGEESDWPLHCKPRALTTLLGREFHHALFDARTGFDVAAFAALGGTLTAGSWLVLLTPQFSRWRELPDADSLRWSDTADPIACPVFVEHFCRTLLADRQTLIWREGEVLTLPEYPARPEWHAADGQPAREQAQILGHLRAMPPGVAVVTAARGRGKSALAGMHITSLDEPVTVTAPARAATDVLAHYAGERFNFIAPDALLARLTTQGNQTGWLVVDEAAAIPGPLLHRLVCAFERVLLITTVQGYEGTGKGFLLKFCAGFPHLRHFTLDTPQRWAMGCPLEQVLNALLLLEAEAIIAPPDGEVVMAPLPANAWQDAPAQSTALYRLLASAHYRTSPLDLRRMMDAPGQHFWRAERAGTRVAALWLVDEGGLSSGLSEAVWAGFRRPRGNLVAQSLAAHGGSPLAATLRGRRVSRIAVHPFCQRAGIGRALIERAREQISGCDYLSVSFGYTPELWRFWQRCGFSLVRLGSHREASSGCFTAMALIPLSPAGEALLAGEQTRLGRELPYLPYWHEQKLALPVIEATTLNEEDWRELAGFAFAHRPLSAAFGALHRLLAQGDLPLAALRGQLLTGESEQALCLRLFVSGRKGLLARQREECQQALHTLDAPRAADFKLRVQKLQFF